MLAILVYHTNILIEALRKGYNKMSREGTDREPSSNWSMLHPMFYSLSFLSQRVQTLTFPKCMAPDHSKFECALSSLEPIQEQSRHQYLETVWATSEAIVMRGHSNNSTYSFSYNEGQCFQDPKQCDHEHKSTRCRKEHRIVNSTASFVPATSA